MTGSDKHGMFDSLEGKGEEALDKFMDDPQKVAEAREKAEDMLGKHMDQEQADKLTNSAEEALRKYSDRSESE